MKRTSLFFVLLLLLGIQQFGWSKIFTSVRNGDWGDPATWGETMLTPNLETDTVIISKTITIGAMGSTWQCQSLTINNGGILQFTEGGEGTNLTVIDNIIINTGGILRASDTYTTGGDFYGLTVGKNFTNNGTFIGKVDADDKTGSRTIFLTINGTGKSVFSGSAITVFGLNINKTSITDTCVIPFDITILSSLNLTTGTLNNNGARMITSNLTKLNTGKIIAIPNYNPNPIITYNSNDTTGAELPTTLHTLNLGGNLLLTKNVTITKSLPLAANIINTGNNTITIMDTANVTQAGNGRVIGNFAKKISTTTTLKTFEIGTANGYSPVTIAFNNVTTSGTITASAKETTHPNVIDNTQTLKRYWTFQNNGTVFNMYDATFQYLSVDFNTNFSEITSEPTMVVGKYANNIWSYPTIGIRNVNNANDGGTIQVTGLTSFSDFTIAKNTGAVGLSVKNLLSSTIPTTTELLDNYPNPFNPTTTIAYNIAEKGLVKLVVFDMLGKEITTLVNENQNPGSYIANFDASKISSGMYFYQLTASGKIATKKMMVVK